MTNDESRTLSDEGVGGKAAPSKNVENASREEAGSDSVEKPENRRVLVIRGKTDEPIRIYYDVARERARREKLEANRRQKQPDSSGA